MEWSEWNPLYSEIVRRLSIDSKMDYKATALLSEMIADINPEPLLHHLGHSITGRDVIVCGSGPSLERHVAYISNEPQFKDSVILAADGAISVLLDYDVGCHYLVTDLDGEPRDLLASLSKGTIPVVHAHGDNIQNVQKLVPEMGVVLGSTQVIPSSNVFLWGGFTDGDRACYLAAHYTPRRIILAGMDFGLTVGKWSKPGHEEHFLASERKRLKLEIAQELLEYLWESRNIEHSSLDKTIE
ncbi:MAG: 6-hydroxymethylpterin diphosphokinase MptE-like protein [Candidatus Thorarchaeota archaeon]